MDLRSQNDLRLVRSFCIFLYLRNWLSKLFDLNFFYTKTRANFVVLYLLYLHTGEWSQLCSLDLICDSPKAFEKWTSAVSGYCCDIKRSHVNSFNGKAQ